MSRILFGTVLLATPCALFASAVGPAEPTTISRFVAIDNVCAWPNLVMLRDGSMSALIHNQPAHGQREGDVECWTSADGEFWTKTGIAALHEPKTIRMNHAAGIATNGDFVVLCSGWTNIKQPERPKQPAFRDAILRTWVCRSTDGGRTWRQEKEFPAPDTGWTEYIPFGPIIAGDDGALHASCYGGQYADPTKTFKTKAGRAWHFISEDDGKSWRRVGVIGPKHNETSLLHLGGKRWLAAARAEAVDLFRSDDDGATWTGPQRLTQRNEINGHLLRLKDGRIVVSYGNRIKGQFGVLAKLSADDGTTWGEPLRLANSLEGDCGYPSSLQRADGKIVTAYYARRAVNHERYHMGVAIWEAPAAP